MIVSGSARRIHVMAARMSWSDMPEQWQTIIAASLRQDQLAQPRDAQQIDLTLMHQPGQTSAAGQGKTSCSGKVCVVWGFSVIIVERSGQREKQARGLCHRRHAITLVIWSGNVKPENSVRKCPPAPPFLAPLARRPNFLAHLRE